MACYARYRNRSSSNNTTTSPIMQTSRFLSLPRELRDHILTYLIEERQLPPRHAPYHTRSRPTFRSVYYPPYRPFRWPPIIWTCRQLREETSELALEPNSNRPAQVELDLLFKGREVWPTYTYLPPVLPREVPFDLAVQIRIFSTEAFQPVDVNGTLQPAYAIGDLLWLLNTLLHNGPSHSPLTDKSPGLYRINKLRVDISFQDYYTPATHPDAAHEVFKSLKALAADGLKPNIVRTVEAHTSFRQHGKEINHDSVWEVSEECDVAKWDEWNELGYFCPAQIYSRSSCDSK